MVGFLYCRLDWRNNIDLNILPTQSMLLPDAEDKTNEEQSVVGESIIQVSATADATVGWKRRYASRDYLLAFVISISMYDVLVLLSGKING